MTTNRVTLVGYVGIHLSTKKLNNGSLRIVLRVATHERENSTTWHNVAAFNAQASFAARNFVKGSRIMVEGHLTYVPYLDAVGRTQYATLIHADYLVNLDR